MRVMTAVRVRARLSVGEMVAILRVRVRVKVKGKGKGYGEGDGDGLGSRLGVTATSVWADVTPLAAHRAPALQCEPEMCTLTEHLTAKIRTLFVWSSGPTPLSSRAWTFWVEACVHTS